MDRQDSVFDPIVLDAIAAQNRWVKRDAIFAKVNAAREPLNVWRLEDGHFEEVDAQPYQDAIGEDRSRWPRNTFTFRIDEQSNDRAVVFVANHYDRGIVAQSRGGNSSYLTLTLVEGEWQSQWQDHMRWD